MVDISDPIFVTLNIISILTLQTPKKFIFISLWLVALWDCYPTCEYVLKVKTKDTTVTPIDTDLIFEQIFTHWQELTQCPSRQHELSFTQNIPIAGFELAIVNLDLRIAFTFLRIFLSNFLWNSRIKTYLLLKFLSSEKPWDFCSHFKFDTFPAKLDFFLL